MDIAIIAFDGFTDVDAFLPFDFFHRVTVSYGAAYEGPWQVRLLADRPRITSYSALQSRRMARWWRRTRPTACSW